MQMCDIISEDQLNHIEGLFILSRTISQLRVRSLWRLQENIPNLDSLLHIYTFVLWKIVSLTLVGLV